MRVCVCVCWMIFSSLIWAVKDRPTKTWLLSDGVCFCRSLLRFCSIIYRSFIVFLFRAFCTFIPHELRYGTNEWQLTSTNLLLNDFL